MTLLLQSTKLESKDNQVFLARRNISQLELTSECPLHMIQSLDVSGNQLTELPEELFPSLESLKRLRLEGNRLTQLHPNIKACRKLEMLSLGNEFDGNSIVELPKELGQLISLRYFYASHNQIKALPMVLLACHQLEVIKLDYNNIADLPSTLDFEALTRLEELNVSHNKLQRLESQIKWPSSLRILDLSNNAITQVHEAFISTLPDTTITLLSGNTTSIGQANPIMILPELEKHKSSKTGKKLADPTKLLEQAARSAITRGDEIHHQPISIERYLAKPPKICATCPFRFYCGYPTTVPLGLLGSTTDDGDNSKIVERVRRKLMGHPEIQFVSTVCSLNCQKRCQQFLQIIHDQESTTTTGYGHTIRLHPSELNELAHSTT